MQSTASGERASVAMLSCWRRARCHCWSERTGRRSCVSVSTHPCRIWGPRNRDKSVSPARNGKSSPTSTRSNTMPVAREEVCKLV